MGQKVNPVGFRLGVNRGWDSVWYAKKKDFGNYLIEDFKIRESPIPCWESFRCSACDYQDLQHAWVKVKNNFKYQLPIAE